VAGVASESLDCLLRPPSGGKCNRGSGPSGNVTNRYMKKILKTVASNLGFEVRRVQKSHLDIPDGLLYRPLFSPWWSDAFQKYYSVAAPRTLVTPDRCYVLFTLLQQALALDGDIVECGVYRGGTAAMLAKVIVESGSSRKLYLFDTFGGMPETDSQRDLHVKGDFSDTSLEAVQRFVNQPKTVVFRKGFIPETFVGLEAHQFSFAHIDVDIYRSIIDSLEFIWPRLLSGGFIVFDDYGFPSCPGARQAVDQFFAGTKMHPLCLSTGQAVVFKY
jgi:O-methyltransferase